jgi:hypothetical protein
VPKSRIFRRGIVYVHRHVVVADKLGEDLAEDGTGLLAFFRCGAYEVVEHKDLRDGVGAVFFFGENVAQSDASRRRNALGREKIEGLPRVLGAFFLLEL